EAFGQQASRASDSLRAGSAVAGGGVERPPARVVGHFEAAAVKVRDSVDDALSEIDPDRHARRRVTIRSGRRSEVVDLLPGRADTIADDVRKQLAEPGTAGEDVGVRAEALRVLQSAHALGAVRPAGLDDRIAHHLARPARRERASPPLEPNRLDPTEADLRIT